jgi:hypothetical protein
MTTSRAKIAAPISQFMTMRIRSATDAIGSAGDDVADIGLIHLHVVYWYSINGLLKYNKPFIEYRQVAYR